MPEPEHFTSFAMPGGGGGSVPVPDPTVATTAALMREIGLLETSIDLRLENAEKQLFAAAGAHRELVDAELGKVNQRFELQEQQRIEQKNDTKLAVDAALQAQKEAVREQTTASERAIAKSETATNKQLEQLSLTFATSVEGLRRSIDEVKERLVDESKNLRQAISDVGTVANSYGQQKQGGVDTRALLGWVIAAVVGLVAIGGFLIDLATK